MNNEAVMKQSQNCVTGWFTENESHMAGLSDAVWRLAETKFEEFESAKLLSEELARRGFTVTRGAIESLPTSFIAEWSNGEGPVIAMLGEYDALPGLGNELCSRQAPNGKNGHGCGHNLLGVGSMAAAIASASAMKQLGIGGTIRYYGCPAEEGGAGKVFMVRDGAFKGIDAVVRWHPINATYVSMSPSLALTSVKYQFHGKSAHAGVMPHLGRSALDAAILMDVGVNYLREHIPSDVRVHSVITDGGRAPNMVPDYSEIWYYIRAPHMFDVHEVAERMEKVALGMAMATGTTVDIKVITGSSETLPNQALSDRMLVNLLRVGPPDFSDSDRAFAKEVNADMPPAEKMRNMRMFGIADPKFGQMDLHEEISANMTAGVTTPYSTDSGDVSWQAPMCQVFVASQTVGSANHSWQQVVCSGMSIGHKGMLCAGKTLAMTALDILTDPELLAAAKEEFREALAQRPYVCPLPPDLQPCGV